MFVMRLCYREMGDGVCDKTVLQGDGVMVFVMRLWYGEMNDDVCDESVVQGDGRWCL